MLHFITLKECDNSGKTLAVNSGISPTTLAYFHPIEPWWQKIKIAIRKELPTYNFHVPQAADAAFQTW